MVPSSGVRFPTWLFVWLIMYYSLFWYNYKRKCLSPTSVRLLTLTEYGVQDIWKRTILNSGYEESFWGYYGNTWNGEWHLIRTFKLQANYKMTWIKWWCIDSLGDWIEVSITAGKIPYFFFLQPFANKWHVTILAVV